jgi:DHA3 family macrolide efflux protein-like MFS transporter
LVIDVRAYNFVEVYEQTGSIMQFAANTIFLDLPGLLVLPIAGYLVDKYNRRNLIVISDLFAVFTNIFLVYLHLNNSLQVWHVFFASNFQISHN